MKKNILTPLCFGLLLLVAGGMISCSSKDVATSAVPETVAGVELMQVNPQTVPGVFQAVGTVQAAETAQIAPQMMGTIVAVMVTEGSRVTAGQMLARINPAQPQAGLEQAQANLSAAEHEVGAAESAYKLAASTMERYELLHQRKSVSAQEYDEIRQQLQTAAARRDVAKANEAQVKAAVSQAAIGASYTRIRAPFSGVITLRNVDPGALASPGVPLFTLESTARFHLQVSVDESKLQSIRQGQSVPVEIDAIAGKEMAGKVLQIYPAGDASSRSVTVKIELPQNAALRSGLFGRANFSSGQRTSIVIPQSAGVRRGNLTGVYVIGADKIAQLRYVTLGNQFGNRVEVLSGLNPNEMIIVSPDGRELSGKRVEAQE